MAVSANSISTSSSKRGFWLFNRRWDLEFITLSVILIAAPYTIYLLLLQLQPLLGPLADSMGTTVESISRNLVNGTVALLVGGPHMYATWTRTYLDRDFAKKNNTMLYLSLVIPAVVISLALFNLPLLLTIFFFWASIHVLHQIIYITEMYNEKTTSLTTISRLADYAVILTALYPLAVWKIVNGGFTIGENDLGEVVSTFIPVGNWMVWLVGGAFAIAAVFWTAKTIIEWRTGVLHKPKTLFITLTVTAAFFVPALGNLDTAFQGFNVWHSFQYLALTWMLNNLREQRGELNNSPFVERMSTDHSARRFYTFTIALTLGTILLGVVIFTILYTLLNMSFDYAFDRSYYIAVLSFLWIHYFFDHYLFVHPEVITSKGVI
jgi:hypothetical protein